ncbi:MAG TPA: DUF1684 domain-containing protein [Bryobacteraceae bacterium]|nr:DUF1684 domain-containing protein [Bryobacteraceae bacterium]
MRTWGWLLMIAAMLPAADAWRKELEEWRQGRETRLRSETGWLSLSGMFWLREGANTIPKTPVQSFELRNGRITATVNGAKRELRPDSSDAIEAGGVRVTAIKRGDRYGIRLWDPNSALRRGFKGVRWFPADASYRVDGRFVAQPRKLPVLNVLGQTEQMESPGYVEFTLAGRALRLVPVLESPDAKQLFFIFRDLTSGKETYGAGRFLYSELPRNGSVVLDFNRAYNPPCAFNPYTTCPLPPKENRLPVRIPAGELAYMQD